MTKVSVVECADYGKSVIGAVKESLSLIGFDIPESSTVLLKPNILSSYAPEKAITTHPSVVDAVCRILNERNCSIIIADSCGFGVAGGTKKAFEVTGIADVARKRGAALIPFEGQQLIEINDRNAKIMKKFRIPKILKEVDVIINLPKLKTHGLTRFTGAVKNMFGILPGNSKVRCHYTASTEGMFCNLLIDIYQNIRPAVSIMDGIIGLEGDGPGSAGMPKKAGVIISSTDSVALDITASRMIGYNPMDIMTTKIAIERGLFSNKTEVVGKKNISVNFIKPRQLSSSAARALTRIARTIATVNPVVNRDKCTGCGTCVKACPVKTIKLDKKAFIVSRNCIHCYCCHELWPHKAIDLKKPFIYRLIDKLREVTKK